MSVSETMKNHMDAVRGVTGASGLLSMAMATDALNDTERINVRIKQPVTDDINFDDIDSTSLLYIRANKIIKAPIAGKWWLVMTAYYSADGNAFQFAVPDDGAAFYLRVKTASLWGAWHKLGG